MDKENKKTIIYIEGNIGSGKSTLVKLLSNIKDIELIQEPIDDWMKYEDENNDNILKNFYEDKKRWTYTFQSLAFITRIKSMYKNNDKNIKICERSPFTDKNCFALECYNNNEMNKLEWDLYNSWFEWLESKFNIQPSGYIYLKTDYNVCFERLKKRNRSEENLVEIDYLKNLQEKHDNWLLNSDVPILLLDGDNEFESNQDNLNIFIDKIVNFINTVKK